MKYLKLFESWKASEPNNNKLNESVLTVSEVESAIHGLIGDRARSRAKTYFDLDLGQLIKVKAPAVTVIFNKLATTLNSPNFNPLTIVDVANTFENEIIALVAHEIKQIKEGLGLPGKAVLLVGKSKFQKQFLEQNSESSGPVSDIIDSVFRLAVNKNLYSETALSQKQLLRTDGTPVPPFTVRFKDGSTHRYGTYADHKVQSRHPVAGEKPSSKFADNSPKDGCYPLDYWEAMDEILEDRKKQIVKKIITNISNTLFS